MCVCVGMPATLRKSTIGGTLIIIPGAFSQTGLLLAPMLLVIIGGAEIYCDLAQPSQKISES